jgi:glycosyl hydrolase family 2
VLAGTRPAPADDRTLGRRSAVERPTVRGKFLYVGNEKLYIRGVTYGTFRPDARGDAFPARDTVERDFAQMAENAVNAVRTYTPPPRWLLDAAQRHGLYVLAGFAWEQHVAFLDDPRRPADMSGGFAPPWGRARATRRSSGGRSATRCRPRSCAGTDASGCSASSSGSIWRRRKRIRARWRRT